MFGSRKETFAHGSGALQCGLQISLLFRWRSHLKQFNVIVKMVKHVTLAQQAVRTPADPPGLQLEQRGRIDAKCFRAIAEAVPKNGETGHSRSKEP